MKTQLKMPPNNKRFRISHNEKCTTERSFRTLSIEALNNLIKDPGSLHLSVLLDLECLLLSSCRFPCGHEITAATSSVMCSQNNVKVSKKKIVSQCSFFFFF